jgi:hypothetical protein
MPPLRASAQCGQETWLTPGSNEIGADHQKKKAVLNGRLFQRSRSALFGMLTQLVGAFSFASSFDTTPFIIPARSRRDGTIWATTIRAQNPKKIQTKIPLCPEPVPAAARAGVAVTIIAIIVLIKVLMTSSSYGLVNFPDYF